MSVPSAAQPAGLSAVAELENQVAPRAPTSSNWTSTSTPSCTWTFAPSGVFANALQVSVNAAPATSKSHDSPGAVQAPIGSDCESRIAAAMRAWIAALSGASFIGTTANPSRFRSDERIAYVCAEMNRCIPVGPMSVKPKPMPVTGFGAPHRYDAFASGMYAPSKNARAAAVASSPSAATRRPCRK